MPVGPIDKATPLDATSPNQNFAIRNLNVMHLASQMQATVQVNLDGQKPPELTPREKFLLKFDEMARKKSALSEKIGRDVSNFDIMVLFVKIMVLLMDTREQQKLSRTLERDGHISNMQSVEELLRERGNAGLISAIVIGITSLFAGAAPIVGHTSLGNSLKDKLSSFMGIDKNMDKDSFFKALSRMLQSISQGGDNANKVHENMSHGKQVKSQTKGDISKLDWEEWTRNIESSKEFWRSLENFVSQVLNLNHEAVRALYSQS